MINVILQFLGLDLFNIKLSAKFYQSITNCLRVKFHFFSEFEPRQNLDQFKCHLIITSVYAKFHHNIPLSTRDRARIWSSAKPRPTKNAISQSFGLDLVNINVYAEVYQNNPLSSRDKAIFTFSEFGAWQSLDR